MDHYQPFFDTLAHYPVSRTLVRALARRRLKQLDRRMGRAVEEMVDLLVIKGVISIDDLSPEVRRLMAERHSFRFLTKVT
jgi:hypothetical protein